MRKRIAALALTACMALTLLPLHAAASGPTATETALTAPTGGVYMLEKDHLHLSAQVTAAAEEGAAYAFEAAGLPVYTLQKMGNDKDNLVLLLLGDGYTQDQQQQFLQEAREQLGRLMSLEPYSRLAYRINVYAVPAVSNEAGLSTEDTKLDTYFRLTTLFKTKSIGFRSDTDGEARVNAIKADLERRCLDKGAFVDNIHMFVNTDATVGSAGGIYSFSSGRAKDYAMAHELSHSVGKLGDEYGIDTKSPNVSTGSDIKWKEMMGYRSIIAYENNDGRVLIPTARKCNMYLSEQPFCEVCRLALVRRMFYTERIQNGMDLYVADPEVTTAHNNTEDSETYRVTQENLLKKAPNIRDLSLRTVIQNLSDRERKVKLVLGVVKENGEPREPLKEEVFTVPALTKNGNMEDACIYPTLTFNPIQGTNFEAGDRLVGEVRDAESGEVLATYQEPEYDTYQVDYLLEDGQRIPNTSTTQLLLPKGCGDQFISQWLPQRVGGHDFVRMERDGFALRLFYRQTAQIAPPTVDGGQVQFYVNGTPLGEAVTLAAGEAVLDGQPVSQSAGFQVGENTLTARYLGTEAHAASESQSVTVTVNKAAPVGAEQPKPIRLTNASYQVGGQAAALDGATTVDDGGTVTYQWYRAAGADSFNGTPITGETNAAYTPDTSAAGTYYYYVIATNTKTDGEGVTTAGTTSNMAVITVTAPSTGDGGGGSTGGNTGGTTPSQPGGGSTGGGSSGSGGGGGGGGGSSSDKPSTSTGKTETTTRPDGTKVETVTKPDGTKVETATKPDGTTVKTETKKDGGTVTETKAADGSTGTVKIDKNGQTTAETKVSEKAVEDAKKTGEAVKAPVQVEAARDSNTAPVVKVELPRSSGDTKVEIPVSNVKPGTVAVLVHPDGTEEILKNSVPTEDGIQLTVNGGATVKIVDNSKDFADTRDHWAKDAIDFVSARGLVSGMSETTYAPDNATTRAQLWTILARQNDADLSGGGSWYEKAQTWAKANGISDGTAPEGTINRAQMVTMLYRAAGSPEVEGASVFTDISADSYYAKAAAWAAKNGITAGVGNGRFEPNGTCTRGQIATFLYRYMK